MKVCHITSAHPRNDIRIFHKECKTLAYEHEVHLIVADGLGDLVESGIAVHDIGRPSGRLGRFLTTRKQVARKAAEVHAEVYHLHDPELLTIALRLKKTTGAAVIFDAHEDVPLQILDKHWIPAFLRKAVARAYGRYERRVCKKLDAVVTVTPIICARYAAFVDRVVMVANFPMFKEFAEPDRDAVREPRSVAYVGGLSRTRGVREIVEAAGLCGANLHLAGAFDDQELKNEVQALPGWQKVKWHGQISRTEVTALLAKVSAGLVTLLPTRSYVEAYPIKMFEYMAAGIPVIASDFPLWSDIVTKHACGLLTNPLEPRAIAAAMEQLFNDPEHARNLGMNGRIAALQHYTWESEAHTLVQLYRDIAQSRSRLG